MKTPLRTISLIVSIAFICILHSLSANGQVVVMQPLTTFGPNGDGSLRPGDVICLTSAGQLQRGMAYNPTTGHLLVVDRATNSSVNYFVYILDGASGANLGTLATISPFAGGNAAFPLNLIGVADDGAIYAANLSNGTTGSPQVRLYRWASESDPSPALVSPTISFPNDDPSGGASTLQVRANGVLWHEAPNFFDRGPGERVYVTHTSEAGKTTVEFGDGLEGARPPTGSDNIRATYRKGMGTGGNVDARQLSLLLTRPAGVRGATNPLPASGGTDPEPGDSIRRNAAVTIMTMDRVVSLKDYGDFAAAFAGVAKAMASPWIWSGHARGVFLTVAGPGGADLSSDGSTYANLLAAIRKAGGSHVPVRMQSYRKAFFRLSGTVTVAADQQVDAVIAAVEAALRARFSFEARSFGQPVDLSEVVAVMQAVPGVIAIDLDELDRTDHISRIGLTGPLPAALPQVARNGVLLAAELLVLDPRPVDLKGVLA